MCPCALSIFKSSCWSALWREQRELSYFQFDLFFPACCDASWRGAGAPFRPPDRRSVQPPQPPLPPPPQQPPLRVASPRLAFGSLFTSGLRPIWSQLVRRPQLEISSSERELGLAPYYKKLLVDARMCAPHQPEPWIGNVADTRVGPVAYARIPSSQVIRSLRMSARSFHSTCFTFTLNLK